jgi:hypothetical protein
MRDQELESLAKQFHDRVERVNEEIRVTEDWINGMDLGLEMWLDTPIEETAVRELVDRDGEPTGRREFDALELGYARRGEQAALLLRKRRYVDEPDGTRTEYDDGHDPLLLTDAAPALRVKAATHVPGLLQQIKRHVSEAIDTFDRVKGTN